MSNKIPSVLRERIIRNYGGGHLSIQRLLAMLEGPFASNALQGRNALIRAMAEARSHGNLGAHDQGSKDKTMHYTIYIDGKGHHLRMDSRGVVFHITDHRQETVGGSDPWVAPGSVQRPKSQG